MGEASEIGLLRLVARFGFGCAPLLCAHRRVRKRSDIGRERTVSVSGSGLRCRASGVNDLKEAGLFGNYASALRTWNSS